MHATACLLGERYGEAPNVGARIDNHAAWTYVLQALSDTRSIILIFGAYRSSNMLVGPRHHERPGCTVNTLQLQFALAEEGRRDVSSMDRSLTSI